MFCSGDSPDGQFEIGRPLSAFYPKLPSQLTFSDDRKVPIGDMIRSLGVSELPFER
jgi:hypothetical protein